MEKEILDIFYNEVINETKDGQVDSILIFNVAFNTIIEDKIITENNVKNSRTLIPTLIIKNKNKFNLLLLKYVFTAIDFYKNNFFGEIYDENNITLKKDFIKTILTLLWSNATSEDFSNPNEYLKKRTNFFFNLPNIDKNFYDTSLGKIKINILKDKIINETPYYLEFKIDNNILPIVRFGISDNKAYIYSVQNTNKTSRDKKLNRLMYKVNDGINLNESNDNITNPENIISVTPSTLIATTLALSFFKNNGISEIIVPPILPVRWNAKELAYEKRSSLINNNNEKKKYLMDSYNEHEKIQRNISDKFIRTFRRIDYHFDNINITALPFIHDEYMHILIDNNPTLCNNSLLEELFNTFNNQHLL